MTITELYEKYSIIIYHVCYKYLKEELEASDAMHDVFVKVIERQDQFLNKSQFTTWVYRIAVNHCIDLLRVSKRRQELLEIKKGDLYYSDMVNNLDQSEYKMMVEKVLDTQDPGTKEIVQMYFMEGLSQSEIANLLKVSRVAITKKINRFIKSAQKKNFDEAVGSIFTIFFLMVVNNYG